MTTLAMRYVNDLRTALRQELAGAAEVESSPVRAIAREEPRVISVQLGGESVESINTPRVTRVREIHVLVHTAGDDHQAMAEEVFERAHPVVMVYQGPNIVEIAEFGTDEPKYVNGDLRRQVVNKRYRITYQSDELSLSD
ncbi:hypothetical protein [Achromobacter aegrifaciens]